MVDCYQIQVPIISIYTEIIVVGDTTIIISYWWHISILTPHSYNFEFIRHNDTNDTNTVIHIQVNQRISTLGFFRLHHVGDREYHGSALLGATRMMKCKQKNSCVVIGFYYLQKAILNYSFCQWCNMAIWIWVNISSGYGLLFVATLQMTTPSCREWITRTTVCRVAFLALR